MTTRRMTRRQLIGIGGAGIAIGVAASAAATVGATDAPQVQRVRVSQTNLARGNRFTVTVSIVGDVRAATITYRTPRGGALTQTLRMTYGDNYEAAFLIASNAPVGEYRVDSIVARDSSDRVALRITAANNGFADLVRDARVTVSADGNPTNNDPQPPDNGQSSLSPIATVAPPIETATPVRSQPGTGRAIAFVSSSVSQNLLAFGNAFTARVVVRGAVDTVRVTYGYIGGEMTHSLIFDYTRGDESHYEGAFTVADGLPLGQYMLIRLYAEGTDGSVLDLAPTPDDPLVAGSTVIVTTDGNPVFADASGVTPTNTSGGLQPIRALPAAPIASPTATPRPAIVPATPTVAPLPASPASAATGPIRFTAVTLALRTVRPGSAFVVTATIDDTDGAIVGQPVVNFSDGRRELFAFFEATRTDTYRAVVPVSQYYPEGTYALTRLYAYDDQGNTLELRSPDTAMFGADIIVRK